MMAQRGIVGVFFYQKELKNSDILGKIPFFFQNHENFQKSFFLNTQKCLASRGQNPRRWSYFARVSGRYFAKFLTSL